jgi:pilus assembly protein Flp/PilA
MAALMSRFMKDESGATAIEYGLIAALIATALITGATALGDALNTQFNGLAGNLNVT